MDSARIRSYHARSGRLSATKRAALADLLPRREPLVTTVALPAAEFCRRPDALTVVDIGAGTGEATLQGARNNPDWNVLAIEVHRASLATLLLRIEKAQLANVTVSGNDAVEVLTEGIAPASVSELWVYFPDPWPKVRQRSRRLIQPPFIFLAAALLTDGGVLRLATDDVSYASQMQSVVRAEPALLLAETGADGFSERNPRPLTYYEDKACRAGRRIWDLQAVRVPRAHIDSSERLEPTLWTSTTFA